MEKIYIITLVIFVIFIFGIIFRTITIPLPKIQSTPVDRFVKIQDWGNNFTFYDKETKVQYYYGNGGLTILVNQDGKPLLYEEE